VTPERGDDVATEKTAAAGHEHSLRGQFHHDTTGRSTT